MIPTEHLHSGPPPEPADSVMDTDAQNEIVREVMQELDLAQRQDPEAFFREFPDEQDDISDLAEEINFLLERADLLEGPPPPEQWPAKGETFIDYFLEEQIGEGGFARVFRAADRKLGGKPVVVKVSYRGDIEAKTMGGLHHRNLMPVESFHRDQATDLTVIAMPYFGKTTVAHLIQHAFPSGKAPTRADVVVNTLELTGPCAPPFKEKVKRQSYPQCIRALAAEIADVLAYIHEQGVCHADLKPANVLLAPDGRPLLLDFNLSKDPRWEHDQLGGTLLYMSPEQLAVYGRVMEGKNAIRSSAFCPAGNSEFDYRTDIFAFGVILYEMLSGVHPFAPASLRVTTPELWRNLRDKQRRGFVPLKTRCPKADGELCRLVDSCLELDPNRRPQSAAEIARILRQTPWHSRVVGWMKKHLLYSLLVGLLVFAVAVGAAASAANLLQPAPTDFERGVAEYRQKNYEAAVISLTNALDSNPQKRAGIILARGRAYQRLAMQIHDRRSDKRKVLFEKAISDLSLADSIIGDARTKAALAYLYQQKRDVRAAGIEYANAEKLGHVSAALYNNRAALEMRFRNVDRAQELFAKALALDPSCQAVFYNRASLHLTRHFEFAGNSKRAEHFRAPAEKELEKAVTDIAQAVDLGPPTGELYQRAARIYAVSARYNPQRKERAFHYARKAVEHGAPPKRVTGDNAFKHLRTDPRWNEIQNMAPGQSQFRYAHSILDPLARAAK